jgi:hypothetical protein
VQKALSTLKAGQTALVRAGTYAQNLTMSHAGTSTAPITIRNYPGEKPVLKAGSGSGDNYALQLTSGAGYVRFEGVTFDGATGSSTANVYASGGAHDIELANCEIRNSRRQGIFTDRSTARIQIIGCNIHDNGGGGPSQQDHNIYLEGSHHAVLGSVVARAKNGFGIQVYPSNDHAVIAGNTIAGATKDGIVVGSDSGTTTTGALIVNNIITGSQAAISTYWGGSAGSGNVARNNLAFGNKSGFTGSGITYSKNVTADPKFVDAAGGNFRLQAGSPALSIAEAGYVPAKDVEGTARPQGAGPDLGAYER